MADSTEELVIRRARLTKELSSWQQKAAIAQADEVRIKKDIGDTLTELKNTFGCSTYDEAVTLRDSMEAQLTKMCDDLQEALDALQGT